jgi:hypothetical protein
MTLFSYTKGLSDTDLYGDSGYFGLNIGMADTFQEFKMNLHTATIITLYPPHSTPHRLMAGLIIQHEELGSVGYQIQRLLRAAGVRPVASSPQKL